jgi:group I intron endonuclease
MKKCGIYKITSPSNKIYVGQSKDIYKRWNFYYKNKNCKKQTYLYYSLKKYGWENHVFEIIEYCSIDLLNERERYWQEYYDCINPEKGLNLRLVNTKDKKYEFPQHIKDKISRRVKEAGYRPTEAHKEALRIANIGKTFSEETKKKISEKNTGKRRPNMHSEEFKSYMKNLKIGSKHSEETKQKMREKRIGKVNCRAKKILCITDNISFDSIGHAAKFYNVSYSVIRRIIQNQKESKKLNKLFKYE